MMTQKIKGIVGGLLVLGLFMPSLVVQAQPTNQELFDSIRSFHLQAMPADLIANVQGEVVQQVLEEIPDDERLNPNQPLTARFYFVRGLGETIKICNTGELYRDRLGTFIVLLDNIRSFLDPHITWNNFNRLYLWDFVRERGDFYIIRFSKRATPNVFFLLYVDKENKTVSRIARFKDNESDGRVIIRYSRDRSSGLIFPTRFVGWGMVADAAGNVERKDFDIQLTTPIRLNTGLSMDCFLDDRCLCNR